VKCADGEICGLLLTFDATPTVVETRNGADMFEFKPLPAWQIKVLPRANSCKRSSTHLRFHLKFYGVLGGAIDHRLAALPRISEPSSATVTFSGSECGSVVTTSSGSAAEAATEKASTAAKQETRHTAFLSW
jgi:hypothetical protein